MIKQIKRQSNTNFHGTIIFECNDDDEIGDDLNVNGTVSHSCYGTVESIYKSQSQFTIDSLVSNIFRDLMSYFLSIIRD